MIIIVRDHTRICPKRFLRSGYEGAGYLDGKTVKGPTWERTLDVVYYVHT